MKRRGDPIEAVVDAGDLRGGKKREMLEHARMPGFFAQLVPDMVDEIFRDLVIERRLVAMLCKANLSAMEPELYAYTVGDQRREPGPTARNRTRLLVDPEDYSFDYRVARDAVDRIFADHVTTHIIDMVHARRRGWGGYASSGASRIRRLLAGAAAGGHLARVGRLFDATRGFAMMTHTQLAGLLGEPSTTASNEGLAVAVETQLLVASVAGGRYSDAELDAVCTAVNDGFDITNGDVWTDSPNHHKHSVLLALIRAGCDIRCSGFIKRVLDKLPEPNCPTPDDRRLVAAALAAARSFALLNCLEAKYAWFRKLLGAPCTLANLRSPDVVFEIGVLLRFSVTALEWLTTRRVKTIGGDHNTRCREWVAGSYDDPDGEAALRCLRERFGATDAQCL